MPKTKRPKFTFDELKECTPNGKDKQESGQPKGEDKEEGSRRQPKLRETTMTEIILMALKNSKLKLMYPENDPVNASPGRIQQIADALNLYWKCVKKTWPDIWQKPSTEQRLTHKVGLIAMTQLMPLIIDDIDLTLPDAEEKILMKLKKIKGVPWDDETLMKVVSIGRKTDANVLYKAIQTVYVSEDNLKELVLRDTRGVDYPIKLRD